MKRMRFTARLQAGFALPTILIASVVMLTVLTAAVTAVSSLSASIDAQYYNRLAREAAESGVARATDCLKQSPTSTPQWSELAPLRPNTNCDGSAISGKSQYINTAGNINTSFRVGLPAAGSTDATRIAATGNIYLMRSSDSTTVWRAYSQTIAQDSRYRNSPKIAGGAGWQDSGHIAAILTTDQQLYGYGDNQMGQVNDLSSPASVVFPTKLALPSGVSSVSAVKTSGQGASIMCILANTGQVYCRGAAGGGENGLMPTTIGWQQFTLPSGVTATDFSIDGYGADKMCVLGSNGQAYCAGENYYGSLGNGDSTYSIYKINGATPQRFAIPAGVTLTKIYSGPVITCGIATTGDMYCAGLNNNGQITGPSTNGTGNGVYSTPIKYTLPGVAGARKVKDVLVSYHAGGAATVHVLATDGTIWGSGSYANGDLGNGTTTGSTGASQAPTLFSAIDTTGQPHVDWRTGSRLKNPVSGRCIDNNGNLSWPSTGNKIQLYDCNDTPAQTWVYGSDNQLTNLGTGLCLDVPSGSTTAGATLQLYSCNGSDAQKFQLTTDTNGNQIIRYMKNPNLCLDALGAGTSNGTQIQTWTCNLNGAQVYQRMGGINGWQKMVVGSDFFCGVRADNWSGMWCAGKNNWGQLANWASSTYKFMGTCQDVVGTGYSMFNVNLGVAGDRVDPSKVSDEWTEQYRSLMMIGTSGTVYGAGRNQYGKLGNGTIGDSTADYASCVTSQFQLPAGVVAMDMSTRDEYTTYVLGSDGRIYSSGRNNNGQVGDGSTTNRLTPVEVKIPRQATFY